MSKLIFVNLPVADLPAAMAEGQPEPVQAEHTSNEGVT